MRGGDVLLRSMDRPWKLSAAFLTVDNTRQVMSTLFAGTNPLWEQPGCLSLLYGRDP